MGGEGGRGMTMKRGRYTGGGDGEDDDYAPPPPESAAVAALPDSEPEISFGFWGQEAIAIAVGCTDLVFVVFSRGYILVLLGSYSLSSFTGSGTDKGTAALGAARYFLGQY